MRRNIFIVLAFAGAAALVVAALAAAGSSGSADKNAVSSSEASAAQAQGAAILSGVQPEFVGETCGRVTIPGPANSPNIAFTVQNLVNDTLDFLNIDSFLSLGKRSLIHQSVFSLSPPAGGTATDLYPDGPADGKNGVVLAFSGFNNGETSSFNTDPDTYDNPGFGASVKDLNRTRIEAAYVSSGRRCVGTLKFNGTLNASVATLMQVSPIP